MLRLLLILVILVLATFCWHIDWLGVFFLIVSIALLLGPFLLFGLAGIKLEQRFNRRRRKN